MISTQYIDFVTVIKQKIQSANLWRMRNFYLSYRDISWSHNILIFEKCKDEKERELEQSIIENTFPVYVRISLVIARAFPVIASAAQQSTCALRNEEVLLGCKTRLPRFARNDRGNN